MGDETDLEGLFNPRAARDGKDPAGVSRVRRERRRSKDLGSDLTGFLPDDSRQAPVKASARAFEPRPRPAGTSRWSVISGIDMPLLLVTCTLLIFGLLMVNSASWAYSLSEYGSANTYFFRQLLWTFLGIVAAGVAVFFNYHRLQKFAVPLMIVTLLSLVGVLLFGQRTLDATRAYFSGSIQPSELAKVVIIIYLSIWLFAHREDLGSFSFGLFPLIVILGMVGGLIGLQPDFSALLTVGILGVLMFFLAGGEWRQIIFVSVGAFIVAYILIQSNIFESGKDRIIEFINGMRDPLNSSEHVQHSLEAFVRGGWFGVGIGKGDWKLTLLPVPHTDSIFAVIGEETGFVGAVFVVVLYALLLWRGLSIARRASDQLGMLLAGGLTFWIAIEAFINMAVMLGLMPFAGNALPLISAGGSSRMVTLAAIGILMNISRVAETNKEIKERKYSAVVDLRRRDGRGSISRVRRPSSALRQD